MGIKLVSKGSVAIFCGRKETVLKLCKTIVKNYARGLNFPPPSNYSIEKEISKLYFLHQCNLGEKSVVTQSANFGIYAHSRNTPHGIRLAIEHAMQKDMIKFVICTSTLAQGINLPIRYLILTSIYQAGKKIKVRDFHNLIGRVGRLGMYTEGSIIFSDPNIFDQKVSRKGNKRWNEIEKLLDPKNSERCASAILTVFNPIYNDNETEKVDINLPDYVHKYIDNSEDLNNALINFAQENKDRGYSEKGVLRQAKLKADIFASIESYLMAHWEENDFTREIEINRFVEQTLGYQLCNEEQKSILVHLFYLIAQNIKNRVPNSSDCRAFGRTLYGLNDSIRIRKSVLEKENEISKCDDCEEMLLIIWPIIHEHLESNLFRKITSENNSKQLVNGWIKGLTYFELHNELLGSGARIAWGTQKTRTITLEQIIDVCDIAIAYESTLLIGAIIEMYSLINPGDDKTIKKISQLQKRLKYGLPSDISVGLYEIGFSDRVIAIELSYLIDNSNTNNERLSRMITKHEESFEKVLEKYPSYYKKVLDGLLENR